MAFDRSGRPREPQRGFHGRTIPLEHGSKGAQLHAGTGATGQEPRVQRVGVTLTEHRRTLLSQLLHVRECGVLRKPFHTGLCLCCPLGDGLEKEPGELACCWQPWGSRLVRHGRTLAVGMEPLGDEGARPPHALLPALPPSTCLSGTALGPACREGGERALHFPGAPITTLIGRHGPGPARSGGCAGRGPRGSASPESRGRVRLAGLGAPVGAVAHAPPGARAGLQW